MSHSSPHNPRFEAKHPRDRYGRFADRWVDKVTARIGLPNLRDRAVIDRMYGYEDPQTGHRFEVDAAYPLDEGRQAVQVNILNRDGTPAGEAVWTLYPHQARANLDGIALTGGHKSKGGPQGQGVVSRWLAQVEDQYRQEGIRGITLLANIDVGAYAWARAGYEFAAHEDWAAVAINAVIKSKDYGPEAQAEASRLLRNDQALPVEFAMIGWTPGATTWPGKEMLLGEDVSWYGVKRL